MVLALQICKGDNDEPMWTVLCDMVGRSMNVVNEREETWWVSAAAEFSSLTRDSELQVYLLEHSKNRLFIRNMG